MARSSEVRVGAIVVRGRTIYEPLSDTVIARGFPSQQNALCAARAMNEVADWLGVLRTRAAGRRPNCQDELAEIARAWGGTLGTDGGEIGRAWIAEALARIDMA